MFLNIQKIPWKEIFVFFIRKSVNQKSAEMKVIFFLQSGVEEMEDRFSVKLAHCKNDFSFTEKRHSSVGS